MAMKFKIVFFRDRWAAEWTDHDKRRHRHSLGTSDREEGIVRFNAFVSATREGKILPRDAAKLPYGGSYVYFIRCGQFIKIGSSENPANRLRALRTGNPFPLSILKTVPGDGAVEFAYQREFRAHLHRDEWFRDEGSLREFLGDAEQLAA